MRGRHVLLHHHISVMDTECHSTRTYTDFQVATVTLGAVSGEVGSGKWSSSINTSVKNPVQISVHSPVH